MHTIFHMSLLDLVISNLVSNQILSPILLLEIDDIKKLEVAAILNLYKRHGQIKYYIQWVKIDNAT